MNKDGPLFDASDIAMIEKAVHYSSSNKIYVTFQTTQKTFFSNKSVQLNNLPNTLEEIGIYFNCTNNISRYQKQHPECKFFYKIKLEKDDVFELSIEF